MGAIARTTAADRRSSVRIAALLEPGTSPVIDHFIAGEAWDAEDEGILAATSSASSGSSVTSRQ
ncbi:MAG: hypothetical protein ABSC94_08690 [Polyangiaceae bacterium]|jgi:hypothetical protein